VFGDSHVHRIQGAVRRRRKFNKPVTADVRRLIKLKAGQPIGDTSLEDIMEMVANLGPDDVVVAVIGGNQHAIFSTIQHPQPFDLMVREDGDSEIREGAELIPYRTMYSLFASIVRQGNQKTLEALRSRTKARIVLLMAPPPKRDNRFIEQYHDSRFAAEGIASNGVSPPALRMKFWKMQNRILADICSRIGIELLEPPEDTSDPDGFLAKPFWGDDATHGNAEYGERVLQQIEARFSPVCNVEALA